MSNDKFKSVEHRVLANHVDPRISLECFFSTQFDPCTRLYGPIEELLSDGNPPIYREVTLSGFTDYYSAKGLDSESTLD